MPARQWCNAVRLYRRVRFSGESPVSLKLARCQIRRRRSRSTLGIFRLPCRKAASPQKRATFLACRPKSEAIDVFLANSKFLSVKPLRFLSHFRVHQQTHFRTTLLLQHTRAILLSSVEEPVPIRKLAVIVLLVATLFAISPERAADRKSVV